MRDAALSNIALMVTLYAAVIIWGMQHLSDRYSPKLLFIFLLRVSIWPFFALVVILCVAGLLLLPSVPHAIVSLLTHNTFQMPFWAGDVLAFVLLLASIMLIIATVAFMVWSLTTGTPVISWLRKRKDRVELLEDILLNTIEQNNVRLTRTALSAALGGQQCIEIIEWLKEHRSWLAISWFARELLDLILSSPLDTALIRLYSDLLCLMLAGTLEVEEQEQAWFVLDTLCNVLERADTWEEEHMNLLDRIGFTLWKVGDYMGSTPRTARIPEQLEGLQWHFIMCVRRMWYHVLDLKNSSAVYYYTMALCELILEARETKEQSESLLSQVFDVLQEGFGQHLLSKETIQELASELGHLRRGLTDQDEETQNEIDSYLFACLAILDELGAGKDELGRVVANGYLRHRVVKGKWLGTDKMKQEPIYYTWLSTKSYTAARKALGLPGLSKKQVREITERRAGDGERILVELDTATDDTSHPLPGRSPTTPILIKAPRIGDRESQLE